jgi:uncharacterized protein YgbK (DUF1537 family)
MLLGAVADDFTGATDLATTLRGRGMTTVVVVGDRPVAAGELDGVDAVVVALKSRTAPVADAVATSEAALERVLGWGAERVYLKYCSTFDSTDTGNIGPVLDAFRDRLGVDRVVVVPAFPANGRRVYRGHLFVGDDLLEESSMRHHPLTPMTRSRLRDILTPQTTAAITEIPLEIVRQGEDVLRAAVADAPSGNIVIDAIEDEDLRTIARATSGHRLISGGAGLAIGMDAGRSTPHDTLPAFIGRRLVVCGSASATTRSQIDDAAGTHPLRRVDLAAAVADPDAEIEALAAWIRSLDAEAIPVVYSVRELSDIAAADGGRSAAAVERVLSGLVSEVVGTGDVDRVVVAGGETSGAVVTALGVGVLTIGPQLAPGVCWSTAPTADGRDVALVLKSGNFGALDLFSSAWTVFG